jgi:hypothetical protein
MKKLIFFLMVVILATQVFGQRKGKVDPKDLKIDSLSQANAALTLQLDSVSKDYTTYYGVYTAVKDSVIKYNFDPSKTTFLIDSLKSSRNSAFAEVNAVTASLKDTIKILIADNKMLQSKIDSLSVKKEVDITKMASDLKVLKELLDSKTLTQEEFDKQKGIIMQNYQ